jgi:hypothetical protein
MGRKFIVFRHCGSEIYKSVIEKNVYCIQDFGIMLGEGQTTLSPPSKCCNHREDCKNDVWHALLLK